MAEIESHQSSHCVKTKVNVSWSDVSKQVEEVVAAPDWTLYLVLMGTTGRNLVEQQLKFNIAHGTPGKGVQQHGIGVQTSLVQLLGCTVEVFIGTAKQCTLKIGF